MGKSLYIILLSCLIGLLLIPNLALGAEKGGASAFTDGTSMNLQHHPGRFVIPEGKKAVNIKFEYHSPKGEYFDNGVGINITNSKGETLFFPSLPTSLGPGEYTLTVGTNPGMPGAWGSIYYDLQ